MNEITIGDKIYISAKRAAEITGYARDYVGQLCREGHVDAKMVGRSWYVYEPSIRAHRFGPETVSAVEAPITNENEVVEAAAEPIATQSEWNRPRYTSEVAELLPEMTVPTIEEILPPAEETLTDMQSAWREWFDQKQKVLDTPEIESPEVIDARNEVPEAEEEPAEVVEEVSEEASFEVPLHRIGEEPEIVEEQVPIRHLHEVPDPIPAPISPQYVDIQPVAVRRESASQYSAEYAVPQAEHGRIVEERIVTRQSKGRKGKAKAAHTRGSNAPIIALLVAISFISITIAAIGTGYAGRYVKKLPAQNNPVINFLVGTREFSR